MKLDIFFVIQGVTSFCVLGTCTTYRHHARGSSKAHHTASEFSHLLIITSLHNDYISLYHQIYVEFGSALLKKA